MPVFPRLCFHPKKLVIPIATSLRMKSVSSAHTDISSTRKGNASRRTPTVNSSRKKMENATNAMGALYLKKRSAAWNHQARVETTVMNLGMGSALSVRLAIILTPAGNARKFQILA